MTMILSYELLKEVCSEPCLLHIFSQNPSLQLSGNCIMTGKVSKPLSLLRFAHWRTRGKSFTLKGRLQPWNPAKDPGTIKGMCPAVTLQLG